MKYHTPRKRFGQNFLEDPFVIQKILQSLQLKPDDHLIEIGPGLGALTKPLLQMLNHLEVIELDRDLAKTLQEECHASKNLTLHQADTLKFDFQTLFKNNQKLKIVGNLPYNISTPLLFHLLKYSYIIQDMHFMLQKEVVDRLIAKPNSKAYGRLSIMTQYHCETHFLFTVPPTAFRPAPKVTSAFIRLIPYAKLPFVAHSIHILQEITTHAFTQRRKILQNSLKKYLELQDFERLSINPLSRPENLSVNEFVQISNYIQEKRS